MIVVITRRGLLVVVSILLVTAALAVSPSVLDRANTPDVAAAEANPKPYYRGPADKPLMSLMVNVDWGDEFIPEMLKTFAVHGVSATWFPTGRWANRTPELLKLIADAGHEIGNHGGWHGMASKMSAAEVERLIREGGEAVFQATGQRTMLFAPPSGDMNEQTVGVAARMGYKTILWTIDTVDWQRPAASVIVDRVMRKAQNGALVLMHPTKATAEALPAIIQRLREQGFELVTVSKLLGD